MVTQLCSLLSQVVKLKGTEKVYALKILNKWEMLKRHQVSLVLQEHITTGSTCYWSSLADIRDSVASLPDSHAEPTAITEQFVEVITCTAHTHTGCCEHADWDIYSIYTGGLLS